MDGMVLRSAGPNAVWIDGQPVPRSGISSQGMRVDLERMGDEAVRIARMAAQLANRGGSRRGGMELRHLGPRVQGMLRSALDAFARMDPEAAAMVVAADRDVDREYESLSREMITFMMEDPRAIQGILKGGEWLLDAVEAPA